MQPLRLPTRVLIQLVDNDESPLGIPNMLFRVTAFASRKNDFVFQPFASDDTGLVTITKKDLEAGVADCYDEGAMDYSHISECSSRVEIRLLTDEEVRRAVDARKIWKKLLAGERGRWNSIEELLNVYKAANNTRFLPLQPLPMRVSWSDEGAEHSYKFGLIPRNSSAV
jgi:hypothetical protein